MKERIGSVALLSLLGLASSLSWAAPPVAPVRMGAATNRPQIPLAPVKASEAVSTHGPYGLGDCS
ncbi:MAG TPA: hypothetical protein VF580_05895, partial [Thermoanaerobaculia bacterium]